MARSESTKSLDLKSQIRRWLSEDYAAVELLVVNDMQWAFKATTADDRKLLVGRPNRHDSMLLLSSGLTISDSHESKFGMLPREKVDEFFFDVAMRLLTMGLEYEGLSPSPKEIWVHSKLYLDGLTHDTLSQRSLLVLSAISIVRAGIARLFGEGFKRASSQEEVN